MSDNPQQKQPRLERVVEDIRNHLIAGVQEKMTQFIATSNEIASKEEGIRREAIKEFRRQGEAVTSCVMKELEKNFDPDAMQRAMQATISITLDELSLQDTESVDESIALGNIGDRAELLYEYQLWELRQRIEPWRNDPNAALSNKSLAPYAICRAFAESLHQCQFSTHLRLPLLTQFDRHVLRKLHDTYDGLTSIFEKHGLQPQLPGKPANTKSAKDKNGTKPDPQAGLPPTTDIDPQTWQLLQQLAGGASSSANPSQTASFGSGSAGAAVNPGTGQASPSGWGPGQQSYSDMQLAQDLSSLLAGGSAPGWDGLDTKSLNATASTVGRAFNQLVSDPYVSRSIQPQFNALRFEVLKSALSDAEFFKNVQNQHRALLDELASMAASSRLFKPTDLDRFNVMLEAMREQFAVDPHAVRNAQTEKTPANDNELNAFLNKQRDNQKIRRKDLVEKARQVVSEELWLQIAGRHCSELLKQEIAAGWEPMMALRLLRHGVNSELWDRGISLLQKIIDVADPTGESSVSDDDFDQLMDLYADELSSVGMLTDRIARLKGGLNHCLRQSAGLPAKYNNASMAAQGLSDSAAELLTLIVVKGRWFEVRDRVQDATRWMQAHGISEDGASVKFEAFRGKEELVIPAMELIEDLSTGASAPVNPSPKARAALEKISRGRPSL